MTKPIEIDVAPLNKLAIEAVAMSSADVVAAAAKNVPATVGMPKSLKSLLILGGKKLVAKDVVDLFGKEVAATLGLYDKSDIILERVDELKGKIESFERDVKKDLAIIKNHLHKNTCNEIFRRFNDFHISLKNCERGIKKVIAERGRNKPHLIKDVLHYVNPSNATGVTHQAITLWYWLFGKNLPIEMYQGGGKMVSSFDSMASGFFKDVASNMVSNGISLDEYYRKMFGLTSVFLSLYAEYFGLLASAKDSIENCEFPMEIEILKDFHFSDTALNAERSLEILSESVMKFVLDIYPNIAPIFDSIWLAREGLHIGLLNVGKKTVLEGNNEHGRGPLRPLVTSDSDLYELKKQLYADHTKDILNILNSDPGNAGNRFRRWHMEAVTPAGGDKEPKKGIVRLKIKNADKTDSTLAVIKATHRHLRMLSPLKGYADESTEEIALLPIIIRHDEFEFKVFDDKPETRSQWELWLGGNEKECYLAFRNCYSNTVLELDKGHSEQVRQVHVKDKLSSNTANLDQLWNFQIANAVS